MSTINLDSLILNQSASTLRHQNLKYSIPKAQRFSGNKKVDWKFYPINNKSSKYCTIGKGEKYYIPIWQKKKSIQNPGPDRYNHIILRKQLQKSFPKQQRFKSIRDLSPGPGSYNYQKQTQIGITLKSRIQNIRNRYQPGPAQYHIKDPFASRARSITIKPKESPKRPPQVPGPGAYQISKWPKVNRSLIKHY